VFFLLVGKVDIKGTIKSTKKHLERCWQKKVVGKTEISKEIKRGNYTDFCFSQ